MEIDKLTTLRMRNLEHDEDTTLEVEFTEFGNVQFILRHETEKGSGLASFTLTRKEALQLTDGIIDHLRGKES